MVKRKDNSQIDYSSEREGILVPLVKGIQSFQLKDARWILVIEKEVCCFSICFLAHYPANAF